MGEAWERRPRFAREGSLVLAQDNSSNLVFNNRDEHIPIKNQANPEPTEQVPVENQANLELANDMVQRRSKNIKCWFPGAQPAKDQSNLLGSKDLGTYVFRTLMCIVGKS